MPEIQSPATPAVPADDVEPTVTLEIADAPVADVEADLLVEDVSIDGMCGVY